MGIPTSFRQLVHPTLRRIGHGSPITLLLTVIACVFFAETVVMALLSAMESRPRLEAVLLDSMLLVLLVFPALLLLLLRPMERHIEKFELAQASLSKSKELLDRLFSMTHVMLAYVDPRFNFIHVNRAYAEADGKTPSEFIGKNHFALFPNEENERVFRRVVQTGEPYFAYSQPFQYSHDPERGDTYWDWSLMPVKDAGGQVEGLILSLVDVTARRKTEHEIRQRNRDLAILNAISTASSTLLETTPILTSVRDVLMDAGGFRGGLIYTYDARSRQLQLELAWGNESQRHSLGTRVPVEHYAGNRAPCEANGPWFTDSPLDPVTGDASPPIAFLPDSSARVCIPLVAHGEIQGLMDLATTGWTEHSEFEQARFFQAVGQIVGVALHNAWLFKREQQARHTAEALRQVGVAMTQSLDLTTILEVLLDSIQRLVPYDSGCVILIEDEDHFVVPAARGSHWEEQIREGHQVRLSRIKNNFLEKVMAGTHGKVVADLLSDPEWDLAPCNSKIRSWLGVPFIAEREAIGLFGLGHSEVGFYQTDHLHLAEALASQAAAAVQNAWLFAQLEKSRERLQTLSRHIVEIQETERGYVARELHDEAGQVLTSLMVGLRLLEHQAAEPAAIVAQAGRLKAMVDSVLENLHRLAMNLRPASLDHLGLRAALRQHLETIAADGKNLKIQMEAVGMDVRLPRDVEVALYRIVQEALSNVIRHSRATRVDVLLERRADKIVAIVEDDGIGFDEKIALNSCRLGLFGMRERAEMLGGSLTVECGTFGGTTILVEVPYGDSYSNCR